MLLSAWLRLALAGTGQVWSGLVCSLTLPAKKWQINLKVIQTTMPKSRPTLCSLCHPRCGPQPALTTTTLLSSILVAVVVVVVLVLVFIQVLMR